VDLSDLSLDAAPAGVVVAIAVAIQVPKRLAAPHGSPGGLIGGLLGRPAWELFATKAVGFDFGSEFEGYDWVIGFASVGVLVGAVLGSALAVKRARRAPAR
jgi:hypothetical protein